MLIVEMFVAPKKYKPGEFSLEKQIQTERVATRAAVSYQREYQIPDSPKIRLVNSESVNAVETLRIPFKVDESLEENKFVSNQSIEFDDLFDQKMEKATLVPAVAIKGVLKRRESQEGLKEVSPLMGLPEVSILPALLQILGIESDNPGLFIR